MRVLLACEMSGAVCRAFRTRGHDAFSCDILPSLDDSPYHYQCPVEELLHPGMWDLMIAFPPCTDLTVACSRLWAEKEADGRQGEALAFVSLLMGAPVEKICIENPVGRISTAIRKPDQIIQPYEFGEDASKKTCLWFKNLASLPIDPSKRFPGRLVAKGDGFVERWSNQTDSGQNRLPPSATRAADRGVTYPGIAEAMAEAWGGS